MKPKLDVLVPEVYTLYLSGCRGSVESMAGRRSTGTIRKELGGEGIIEFASIHFCFFLREIHLVYIFCGILRADI